jgi:hypothetical protein
MNEPSGKLSRHLGGQREDDRGAALMLALAVLFAVSVIVIALVTWTGNSLLDTKRFQTASQMEYATGAAVQLEIQNLRYTYQAATTTPFNCTPGASTFAMNTQNVSVWCTVAHNFGAVTRAITLSSCDASMSSTNCVANPYLKAVVTFDDYANPTIDHCVSTADETSCGTTMTIASWVIG